ncbi:diguanylate cyclase (GGDEF)-like protein [Roseateles asaccharophilus]|uniref:Diguanylate cyclase (GGDEF)-like protein n=1 Tax=Roseateles asaccharophilus TaxID=582607 RepID=A0A4V6PU23_9BURK|nr:diguanylate cyclase (GGDEF)-like protein [Roseateles asaccharophilus]
MGESDSDRHASRLARAARPRASPSLVRRLTTLNLAVLVLTLLLTVLLIASLTWKAAVQRQTDAAELAAGLLANNLASMVAFNDLEAMRAELAGFSFRPDLVELRLLAADGRVLVEWQSPKLQAQTGLLSAPEIEIRETIEFKGEVLGQLQLRERLDILTRSMLWLSLTAGIVILLASLVAAAASRLVQRRALAPIVELGRLAEQVAAQQDYGLRAQVHRLDEVGRLAQRFNEMLARIEVAQEQINQRLRLEQQAGQQFQQLAHHDSLTQLPNRLFFQGAIREMVSRAQASQGLMGLMFIDLDNFKHVNDNHGHDAGDEVLRVVARRMSAVLRRGDLLCRLGGDEFALLLPELQHVAVAEQMAQRLISSVREPLVVGGVLMPVGATVGLAFFPTDAQDADGLLQAADAAMYAAKRAGKNCYRRVAHAQG